MTGGGTGGHLAIVDAVKEHIKNKELIYIGSTKGQDRAWFENDSTFAKKYFLQTQGVMDKGKIGKVFALFNIIKKVFEARKILKKHNAKVVFSVGGFSAAPAAIAAVTLKIPLVISEQNAYTGNLNRILKPFAKAFISAYEDGELGKIYPVKSVYFENARVRETLKNILIVGGSQGSVALNSFALQIAPKLNEMGVKIYHQAGEKNLDKIEQEYKKLGIDAKVFGFTKEMPNLIKNADFAISRAGASTLWEMVANGLPALFVPYPYAANDHQYYNAKFLADKNLGCIVRENELNKELFFKLLNSCNLKEVSAKLQNEIKPDGAKKIAKYLEEFE